MSKRHLRALVLMHDALLRALIARLLSNGTLDRVQLEELLHRTSLEVPLTADDASLAREAVDRLRSAVALDS
jgi:hypothetical protein